MTTKTDAFGNGTVCTDASGQTTTTVRDGVGLPFTISALNGAIQEQTDNPEGSLLTQREAKGVFGSDRMVIPFSI